MRLSYLQKVSRRNPLDSDEIENMNLSVTLKQVAFPQLA
jgi:hypothetical protein